MRRPSKRQIMEALADRKGRKKGVERGKSVTYRVDEHFQMSAWEIQDLMADLILSRLAPEIEAAKSKEGRGHLVVFDRKNVGRDGVQLQLCDDDPPYGTDRVHLVPHNEYTSKVWEAIEAIRKDLARDPVYDCGW